MIGSSLESSAPVSGIVLSSSLSRISVGTGVTVGTGVLVKEDGVEVETLTDGALTTILSSHFWTSAVAFARAPGSTRMTRSINSMTANNKLASLFINNNLLHFFRGNFLGSYTLSNEGGRITL